MGLVPDVVSLYLIRLRCPRTMKALIDADYFPYAHGGAKDDEGRPLAWPLVASRISQQIENICEKSGADEYELYLTGEGNFRDWIATIRPYKGQRSQDKPHHYGRVREYLLKFRNATLIKGMEADDAVSIVQMGSHSVDSLNLAKAGFYEDTKTPTIICTVDKDLDNTPGWHFNWVKDKRYWVDEIDALRNFYCQLLTGDTVDNIPGLFGVGKSSTLLKKVRALEKELDMYSLVREQYEKRFGSYWWKFLLENAQLLWMLRVDPFDKIPFSCMELEIKKRLECLEEQRLENTEAN